jgi:DNA polymerase
MARALLIHSPEHGLDYLCKLLGIGEKLPEILGLTKGLRTLPAVLALQLAEYAINDVDLTAGLYDRLLPGLPDDELELIHLTMRWCCQPVLQIDLPRILKAYKIAMRKRRKLIKGSGTTLQILASQQQFRAHLEDLSIEIPLKTNSKGKEIPAFGKDDLGFRQMIADYPEHKALFDGRLAAKSTLETTRIRRLYKIGIDGTLPMPLKYYGAHTGRWSGADGLNPQNFMRGSEMRKSIVAPPGWVILVSDLKQIEARLNMWFCNEELWLSVFAAGKDIYTATASAHFSIDYEDVTKAQRFFGKTLELGLGYNMGWKKFRTQSALKGIFLTEEEAYRAVAAYRGLHPSLKAMWGKLSMMLSAMYQEDCHVELGPITLVHEGILLPNGMRLDYSGLTPTEDGDWYYGVGNKIKKIYGGAMLENIIQALARIIIADHLLAIEAAGIYTVSSTHDEVLALVREKEADVQVEVVTKIMSTPPDWCPDLPLAVDIGYAREYSK